MAGAAVRQIMETIGLVGVVGSLIFVGLEVRQNSIATRSATNAAVSEEFIAVNLTMASSSELARVMARHAANPDGAPVEDAIQILGVWRALFHTWSNVHRQHLNGTLDPVIYESVVQEISTYAWKSSGSKASAELEHRGRAMRWAWESERFLFNQDFQSFVDGMLMIER